MYSTYWNWNAVQAFDVKKSKLKYILEASLGASVD